MLYEDTSYRKESEIDNAFPYLDKLNKELDELNKQKEVILKKQKPKFKITNIFIHKIKNIAYVNDIILKQKLVKSASFMKDGYFFRVRLYKIFNEKNIAQILHFEFYVNIKYNEITKKKQFFKKFTDEYEAKIYYKNMCGVFKNLRRRDLMEKLFKEKEEEIENLKTWINR